MFTPDILVARAKILREIRAFFDARGFIEVETAVRIAAPAPEPHIDCPTVLGRPSAATGAAAKADLTYLRASPELQMKKLLAAGMDRIYQIGPCFREGETGRRHNPEFTMIEWYRRGEGYRKIAEDLKELLQSLVARHATCTAPASCFEPCTAPASRHATLDFATINVREAYLRYAGWDPWADWNQDRFDVDMATKIEPALKTMGAVFLTDYPPAAASLARITEVCPYCKSQIADCRGGDVDGWRQFGICDLQSGIHQVAERWEFYWDGLELANCFTELCDADEQRRRFEAARAERRALGESDYPLDERFLGTLPAIGSASGVALGIDRLVMVLTGAPDISSVRAPE